ncbi:MAG: DNA polymerase III subunit delta [Candidatus Omnitrophota bacterium]
MVKSQRDAYLFCGEDSIRTEEAQKGLISKLLPSGQDGLNLDRYDAKENPSDIFNAINTPPFLSTRRVVIIKNIELLQDDLKEPFLGYLNTPHEKVSVIMHSRKASGADAFLKAVLSLSETMVFKKPSLMDTKEWIHARARREGKTITRGAVDLLLELKGRDNLAVISGEIEKLVLYKRDDKTIAEEDVELLCGKSSFKRAFELVDAVSQKKRDLALKLVREITRDTKRAHEVLGLMGWQFRKIWKAKKILSSGGGSQEMMSELNVKSFSVDRFLRQVSLFKADEIKRCLKLLVAADRKIKRGLKGADFALEELIIDLTERSRAAS